MAKGDVTMKFDAETAAFLQKVQKQRAELLAAANDARKFGDEMAKAGDKAQSGLDKAAKAIENVTQGIGKISSAGALGGIALKAVAEGVGNYIEKMSQNADVLAERTRTINRAMAGAGQAQMGPSIRKQIHEFGGNIDLNTQAFAAISEVMGSKVSVNDKLAAMKAAAKGREALMSPEKAVELGINFAELARERKPGGGFAGATDQHLQDLAFKLTAGKPGGMSDKEIQFLARAPDKEQAVKLLLAAAQSGERSKTLSKLQDESNEEFDPVEIKKLTRDKKRLKKRFPLEGQRKLDLAAIPAGPERLAAMLANPSLVSAADRAGVGNLIEGAEHLPALPSLQAEIDAQKASQDPETKYLRMKGAAAATESQAKDLGALKALSKQARKETIKANLRKNHPFFSSMGLHVPEAIPLIGGIGFNFEDAEAAFQVNLNAEPTFDDAVDPEGDFTPDAVARQKARDGLVASTRMSPGQQRKFLDPLFPDPQASPTAPAGGQRAVVEALERMHGTIAGHLIEQNLRMGEQNSILRTRRGTSLSNDTEGQK